MGAISLNEDDWLRRATAAAVEAARSVVCSDGLNSRAMVGSLSEIEWGWIVTAAIFGWVKTKAEQAVAEGGDTEAMIRFMGRDPEPWEAGAIETILPALGSIEGVDWSKPIGDWSKDQIVTFTWKIYRLADAALASRDEGGRGKLVRFDPAQAAREHSAANGGSLVDHSEYLAV